MTGNPKEPNIPDVPGLRDVSSLPHIANPTAEPATRTHLRRLLHEVSREDSAGRADLATIRSNSDTSRSAPGGARWTPTDRTLAYQRWIAQARASLEKLEEVHSIISRFGDKEREEEERVVLPTRYAGEKPLDQLRIEIAQRRKVLEDDQRILALDIRHHRARRPRHGRQRPEGNGVRFERESQRVFPRDEGTNLYAPTPIEHHDVLVIAPEGVHSSQQFYRFPVEKQDAAASTLGSYTAAPELMDEHDYGQRKIVAVGRPQDWGPDEVRATDRGPAFVTLPVKPEPGATSCSICYLVNTQNLNFRNAWTAEEWNDIPGGPDLPAAPGANKGEMEVLLAGPKGKVFHVSLKNVDDWTPGTSVSLTAVPAGSSGGSVNLGTIQSVNLRTHMEVWHQLRNGTAMGRVLFDDASGHRVIPLVNITTLTRD